MWNACFTITSPCLRSASTASQVDAHNVVPVWFASDKLEYAAYTIRSKLNRLYFLLTDFPPLIRHPHGNSGSSRLSTVDEKVSWSMFLLPVRLLRIATAQLLFSVIKVLPSFTCRDYLKLCFIVFESPLSIGLCHRRSAFEREVVFLFFFISPASCPYRK